MSQGRKYRVFIDTGRDRNPSDSVSDCLITFNEVLNPAVKGIHVLAVSFPNMIPAFNSQNNALTIDISGVETTTLLDPYFWNTPTDFATYLQTKLVAINPNFTVTFSLLTGKLSITNSSVAFSIITTTNAQKYCAKKLGYWSPGNATSSRSTTATVPLVGTGTLTLLGTQNIYMCSNTLCSSQSLTPANPSSITPTKYNILLTIPVLVSTYQLNSFSNVFYDLAFDINDSSFNTLHLSFLDDDFNLIVFSGDQNGFRCMIELNYGQTRFGSIERGQNIGILNR